MNNCSIPSAHAERQITNLSVKHSFTLCPSFSPYWRTDHRWRNKYTCSAWAGGTFFQLCCYVSFLVVAEIVLGDTYLPYQLCRCVFFFFAEGNSFWLHRLVFWLWQEKVLGATSLPTIPVVPLCHFLVAAGNSFWLLSF